MTYFSVEHQALYETALSDFEIKYKYTMTLTLFITWKLLGVQIFIQIFFPDA